MGDATDALSWALIGLLLLVTAALSAGLIVMLRPLLVRYALARPIARSSHTTPTPQGGGIAVIAAALVGVWLGSISLGFDKGLLALTVAAVLLAVVGAVDDLRTLGPAPKLLVQFVAVGLMIAALPASFSIVPQLPPWIERGILVLGGVWFVNLVNFMDGLDWMTVAEVVPLTAGVAVLGAVGAAPPLAVLVALALLGATIGFAPFNRPVARLFLGDVGSLPIGLLLAFILLLIAAEGNVVAALLLPLYYLFDTTLTLMRRLAHGEAFWEAHRTHFYQRATEGGFTVPDVVARVFVLNVALAGLALVCAIEPDWRVDVALLALGGAMVAWVMVSFVRGKR